MSGFRLKCTSFDFSAGATLQTQLRELTALPKTTSVNLRGSTSTWRGKREGKARAEGGQERGQPQIFRPRTTPVSLRVGDVIDKSSVSAVLS